MSRPGRLGDALLAQRVLTREGLTNALERQRREGVRLGDAALAEGDVSRRDVYRALAQTWGLPFVDLVADPPQPEIIADVDPDAMLQGHWVPVRIDVVGRGSAGRRVLLVATA